MKIKTHFKEFGRDKNGLDCYGLAIEVFQRYGKQLNDVTLKQFLTIKGDEKYIIPTLNIKETTELKDGLLLEFYCNDNRLHVGVSLDDKTFIHATENQGVRISSFESCKGYMKLTKMYKVV